MQNTISLGKIPILGLPVLIGHGQFCHKSLTDLTKLTPVPGHPSGGACGFCPSKETPPAIGRERFTC